MCASTQIHNYTHRIVEMESINGNPLRFIRTVHCIVGGKDPWHRAISYPDLLKLWNKTSLLWQFEWSMKKLVSADLKCCLKWLMQESWILFPLCFPPQKSRALCIVYAGLAGVEIDFLQDLGMFVHHILDNCKYCHRHQCRF